MSVDGNSAEPSAPMPSVMPAPPARRSGMTILLVLLVVVAVGLSVWRAVESNRVSQTAIDELNLLAKNPIILDAVSAQNVRTNSYTEAQIAALDKRYMDDAKTGTGLVSDMLATAPSNYLRQYVAGASGRIIFIMVMDAKGLNVAASRATTDYFQGDEDKWRKTFLKGPGAFHWGRVERDYVTGKLEEPVSRTLISPKTGDAIGAVTIGFHSPSLYR